MATMTRNQSRTLPRRTRKAGAAGFTIIELMVALAVLAILVTLIAPNFNDATLSARLNGFASSLVASAQERGHQAQCHHCSLHVDGRRDLRWVGRLGAGLDRGQPGDRHRVPVSAGPARRVPGHGDGWGGPGGFPGHALTVCRATPVGSEERVVTISGTGAVYVSITTVGSCS
jgi:type IV fimbrial biogenesis protein FimT